MFRASEVEVGPLREKAPVWIKMKNENGGPNLIELCNHKHKTKDETDNI